MGLFKTVRDFFRRVISVILAGLVISGPLSGWFNKNPDNPVVSQHTYIDFSSAYIAELIYPKNNGGFISEPTNEAARSLVEACVVQLILGESENGKIAEMCATIPHEDFPHNTETQWSQNELEAALAGAASDDSIFPEEIKGFLSDFSRGINDIHVYFRDTKYDGVYEFCASYLRDDGECVSFGTGVCYDSNTGAIYGADNSGLFGIGFDLEANQYVLITPEGAWQKKFGYNLAYDIAGEILFMDAETVRIKFEYEGKEYMIQMWKGNYSTLSNGAEIGIYYKDPKQIFQYSVIGQDENIKMSMKLINKKTNETILTHQSDYHWWLAAFKMGPNVDKKYMELQFTLEFKELNFAKKFVGAAKEQQLEGIKDINRIGNEVTGTWEASAKIIL